jgi:hypothetical protein
MSDKPYTPAPPNPELGKPVGELFRRWYDTPRPVRLSVTDLLDAYGRVNREAALKDGEAFEVASALLVALAPR